MQMKKLALAIIASGGCATALAQPSLGGGSVPGAGSGSGMQGPGMEPPEARSSSNASFDAGPVADGATPRASAGAEFEIEDLLSASVNADTFSRSLEGLGQQTADFVSNQGGGSDGGDSPAPPEGGDGGEQPQPPEGGDGGGEQPSPDMLTSMLPSGDGEQPQPPEGGNGGGDQPSPDMLTSMLPSGDGDQPAPPEGGGGEEPSQDDAPTPPEGDNGGNNGESSEPQQFSATVPDDLEEQAPAPTPFQASSLVSATVDVEVQDPSQ